MMEWFLELAESYFGDEVEAALFVEEEVYSPELLYLLDSGRLDDLTVEQVRLTYWGQTEGGTYWFQRDRDIHWCVTII
jgi:hypothetical protein